MRATLKALDFFAPECQESAMNNNKRYQVAIVGGGPVGVALAIDLGLRGILLHPDRAPYRAAADPQGAEPHPALGRALLFLGHRQRAARRAHVAARLPDERHHRLREPVERLLVRAATARDRQLLLLPEKRPAAAVP